MVRVPFFRPLSFIESIYFTSTIHYFYFTSKFFFCFTTKSSVVNTEEFAFYAAGAVSSAFRKWMKDDWWSQIAINDQWISYSAIPSATQTERPNPQRCLFFFGRRHPQQYKQCHRTFIDNWSGSLPKMLCIEWKWEFVTASSTIWYDLITNN